LAANSLAEGEVDFRLTAADRFRRIWDSSVESCRRDLSVTYVRGTLEPAIPCAFVSGLAPATRVTGQRQLSAGAKGDSRPRAKVHVACSPSRKQPVNRSRTRPGLAWIRGREARRWPRAGRGWRRCARAWDSAGRRDLRWSRCGSARHPSPGATPPARCPWPP